METPRNAALPLGPCVIHLGEVGFEEMQRSAAGAPCPLSDMLWRGEPAGMLGTVILTQAHVNSDRHWIPSSHPAP